jgi:hypothetical protein
MTSAARTDVTRTDTRTGSTATGSTPTGSTPTGSAAKGIALSVLVATVGAGILCFLISLGAQALGADASQVTGLQPAAYLFLIVVGVVVGGIGWNVVRRRAVEPTRVLSWLVPVVFVVSLIPDVLVGVAFGAVAGIALGLMHLAVLAVALPTYRRFLPLSR